MASKTSWNFCLSKTDSMDVFTNILMFGNDGSSSIGEIVAKNANLSTLASTVEKVGLMDFLKKEQAITLIAPDNGAFTSIDQAGLGKLLENKDLLTSVLKYHVFRGVLSHDLLEAANRRTIRSINGAEFMIDVRNNGIYLKWEIVPPSGERIRKEARIFKYIPASNGIIFVVNNVLI